MSSLKRFVPFIFLVTSCSPIYVPNLRNSPLFTKAGEVQGSAQFGNGLDVQAAVAISNHIGIMTNFSYGKSRITYESSADSAYHHRHKFIEGGVGYYLNHNSWCFEVYGGYGSGEASNFDEYFVFAPAAGHVTGKFDRFFFQPAIGLNKKTFHFSLVPRISYVKLRMFNRDVSGTTISDFESDGEFFFEPGVLGKVNLANSRLVFFLQGGFSLPLGPDPYYEYRPFQLGSGVGVRLGGSK